jgi:hypothetical protein
MTDLRYLTLREAPHYLREHGYPVSFSTLRKMCLPSRGEGPPVAGRWGSGCCSRRTRCLSGRSDA